MANAPTKRRISIDDKHTLRVLQSYRREAESARRDRLEKSKRNWQMYYGQVDWTHKQDGQSTEHLPKMANYAEQTSAFVQRGLVQFGDFFTLEPPVGAPLTPEQARALLRCYLENIVVSRGATQHIAVLMANAVKAGLFESLVVLKVHGHTCIDRDFIVEPGDLYAGIEPALTTKDQRYWKLRIDLVRTEDYYPDPTGRGLYEIHRVERDLADVWQMAEDGIYDKAAVAKVEEDMEKEAEGKRAESLRNQGTSESPDFRKRCVIEECWGTLLNDKGRPMMENCVTATINDKYVIRRPEANPFWHQESPFVAAPILQNPHTVWSKAFYDDVVSLNSALDELFNLMLDGGIASVWGISQVHQDWLDDPRQISGGIPQGTTLVLNEGAPADGKVYETLSTGKVPPEALNMFNVADREMQAAAMTNDIRLGSMPSRQVKATEVIAAEQSSAVLLDSFVGGLETNIMVPMLRKAWLNIMQNADNISSDKIIGAVGIHGAFAIANMSAVQRFSMFARSIVKVSGLSGTLAKARDFQKFVAMLQGVSTNPMLLESFVRRMNADKAVDKMFRMLNLNPEEFQLTPEEQAQVPGRLQNMQMLSQSGIAGPGGSAAKPPGDRSVANEARSDASGGVEAEMGYGPT